MIFDTDKPYQVTIKFVRQAPKEDEYFASLGIIYTSETLFIKEKTAL